MQICKKLQQLRKDANMSQYELADKIFVSRDLISKWETGERRPSYDNLIKLSEVLSCDIEELMETNKLLEDELASCFPNGFIEKEQNIEEILSSFLRTLPERDCNVFIRRYYFFDDSNQIGKMYDIQAGYVRMILTRTRKKLKKYLSGVYNEQ
ncbi:MAG: XRE family transcriptional regulator [Ruminococcus sp.]|nr:XRE family transcriptional regulator [Candidatus Copronaster equi]